MKIFKYKDKNLLYMNNFKKLLNSITIEELKRICNVYGIYGYSKYKKKNELINFILTATTKEEQDKIYIKERKQIINKILSMAYNLIIFNDKLEKITNIKFKCENNVFILTMLCSGFVGNWDINTELKIENNEIIENCNCRIGINNGLCKHLMILYIIICLNYDICNLPLDITKNEILKFEPIISNFQLYINLKNSDPTIKFEDNYCYYINNLALLTTWISPFTLKQDEKFEIFIDSISLDNKLKQHVTNRIIDPLKKGEKSLRKLKIDNYGILYKIFCDNKLRNKILKTYIEYLNEQPNISDLYELLYENIDENKNKNPLILDC